MTVFVIIGIMILFTFVSLQMLTRQTAQIQLRESTQKLIVDLLKSGALPYYVNTCLDRSLKEGLVLAGQQGGNIYSFQSGSVALPSKYLSMSGVLNGQPVSAQVAYGISMPPLANDTVYPFPPGYPGGAGKSLQVPKLEWKNFGRFGDVTLRRLCDANGANKPFAVGTVGGFTPICLNNMYADVESTQWQLEQFIKKRLDACVNWSAIAQETAYNVTSLDAPNVTLRLGDVDVWVDAFYPIRVKVGGREPVSIVADFHVREPVRLKRVVEIASFMSIYDSYSLNWNISEHAMQLPFWDSFMSLKVFKYPLPGVWHDVVEVQDDASQIDGQPYVFRFVRENRYPVLDYIHEVSENQTFDIVTIENNTIWIMPNPDWSKVYDPDEDNLVYDFTGWKETCDEPFDFVNGLNVYTCSNEVRRPEEFLPQSVRNPGDWTNSEQYKVSQRNASIVTDHSDIGPHNVTVWVCDEEGLCDYQVVRVMVFDIPELHFDAPAVYGDMPTFSASVEDPFRFDASGT
ncbi:hypothetical protein HY772_09965, partial [Candidatus Woesearchaeota archaeon]|nr:hypothetical protein [Candidatus Woesearchaeota archaeon]